MYFFINNPDVFPFRAIDFMNWLLHKRSDCCAIPVTTNKQLAARLRSLIKVAAELNTSYKTDSAEREKILEQKKEYERRLEALDGNIEI